MIRDMCCVYFFALIIALLTILTFSCMMRAAAPTLGSL